MAVPPSPRLVLRSLRRDSKGRASQTEGEEEEDVKILVENVKSKLIEATDAERDWLDNVLTFDDKSKAMSFRMRRGKWGSDEDTKHRAFNARANTFLSGFVPTIVSLAAKQDIAVELTDNRKPVAEPDEWNTDLEWLRDYQFEAVQKAWRAKRGILEIATGGGKTECAFALFQSIKCHWLFVMHKADLVRQAQKRWLKYFPDEPPGIVGDGEWNPDRERRLTIATFQIIHAGIKRNDEKTRLLLSDIEAIAVDECHVLPADSFSTVVNWTTRAFWRFGFSGTALLRGDMRSVNAVGSLGPRFVQIKPRFLIDRGYLAEPIIRMIRCVQPLTSKQRPEAVYRELVALSKTRNQLVVDVCQRATKPALCFVRTLAHGEMLVKMLQNAGIKCEFSWGEKKTQQRAEAIKRLCYGEVDVLVCSVIFQEGIDIPELRSVVVAAGGASIIAAIQRVGRGMRPGQERKKVFEVYDILDEGNKNLERHSKERLKAYLRQEYKVDKLTPGQLAQLALDFGGTS